MDKLMEELQTLQTKSVADKMKAERLAEGQRKALEKEVKEKMATAQKQVSKNSAWGRMHGVCTRSERQGGKLRRTRGGGRHERERTGLEQQNWFWSAVERLQYCMGMFGCGGYTLKTRLENKRIIIIVPLIEKFSPSECRN